MPQILSAIDLMGYHESISARLGKAEQERDRKGAKIREVMTELERICTPEAFSKVKSILETI